MYNVNNIINLYPLSFNIVSRKLTCDFPWNFIRVKKLSEIVSNLLYHLPTQFSVFPSRALSFTYPFKQFDRFRLIIQADARWSLLLRIAESRALEFAYKYFPLIFHASSSYPSFSSRAHLFCFRLSFLRHSPKQQFLRVVNHGNRRIPRGKLTTGAKVAGYMLTGP